MRESLSNLTTHPAHTKVSPSQCGPGLDRGAALPRLPCPHTRKARPRTLAPHRRPRERQPATRWSIKSWSPNSSCPTPEGQ